MARSVYVAMVCMLVLFSFSASAATIGGVEVRDTLAAGDSSLTLSGAGARSRWFMKLYVAALYVEQTGRSASAVVNADEPQAIALHITSGMITSERMTEATMDGFRNATGGDLAPIQADVDAFMKVFEEEISEGDVFDLVYLPGEGVQVRKNGESAGLVGDLTFKKALFGIWLGDKPAQQNLKEAMLGN